MAITGATLNGVKGGAGVVRPWILALNQPSIVREKSGFLFKAGLVDAHLLLAVEPCLIQGERRYHFNMHLAHEDAYTLIGAVNAMGEFSILFKPGSQPLSDTDRARYRAVIAAFAGLLLDGGYSGDGLLDEVTQSILCELGYDPVPDRLAGLTS